MLQEYLTRLVVNKPEDPMKFLLKSITEDPYVMAALEPAKPISGPVPGVIAVEEPSNS